MPVECVDPLCNCRAVSYCSVHVSKWVGEDVLVEDYHWCVALGRECVGDLTS